MSFGYSVSDVLTVTQLAWKCFHNAKEACGEYDELTCEAENLHRVLHRMQLEIAEADSLLNRLDEDRKEELKRLVAACYEILRQVDSILGKYDALKAKTPRYGTKSWQRVKFGNREMQDLDCLRQKLAHHTGNIIFFCTLVGLGSQGRMEMAMRGELLELRQGVNEILAQKKAETPRNESSILTKYDEDDRAVWKEFRRELVNKGFDSTFIQQHMEQLKAYVKELGARGALDVDEQTVAQHQSMVVEGPVRWQQTQDVWLKSCISITALGAQSGPCPSSRFLTELSRISKLHGHEQGLLEFSVLDEERHNSLPLQKPKHDHDFIVEKGSREVISDEPTSSNDMQPKRNDVSAGVDAIDRDLQSSLSGGDHEKIDPHFEGQGDNVSIITSTIMSTGSLRTRPKPPPERSQLNGKSDVTIVIVPDIPNLGSRATIANWFGPGQPESQPGLRDLRIIVYEYEIHIAGPSIWESILAHGRDFLNFLEPSQPYIVISHGLGGLIVKKALTLARFHYPDHTNRLSMLGGLVFLATPHVSLAQKHSLSTVIRLLKYTLNLPKIELSRAELEIRKVSDVCTEFDELNLGLPIISAYETTESRLRKSLWRPLKEILVGMSLALVSARSEVLIPVSSDHNDLCKIERHRALLSHIMEMVGNAHSIAYKEITTQIKTWSGSVSDLGEEFQFVPGPPDSKIAHQGTTSGDFFGPFLEEYLPLKTIGQDFPISDSVSFPIFDVLLNANPSFTGREEALDAMDATLRPCETSEGDWETTRQPCMTICGPGGMGKTELALQYAHTRNSYFNAVFWVRAVTKQSLSDDFKRIAIKCGLLSDLEAQDPVISRNVVLGWLSSTRASWLLVFDNADSPEDLLEYWPISSTGAVIVTSRDHAAPSMFFGSVRLDLQPLSQDDALALLCKSLGRNPHGDEFQACQDLLSHLDAFPLVILQVGGLIRKRAMTFTDCKTYFSETVNEALNTSVSSAFDLTITNLSLEARKLLQIFSFLDPGHLSESLGLSPKVSSWIDKIFGSKLAFLQARTDLLKTSMFHKEKNQLYMHRLVQGHVRARMRVGEAAITFEHAIRLLEGAWPTNVDQFDGEVAMVSDYQSILPHVLSMKSTYEDKQLQLEGPRESIFVDLLQRSAWVFISYQNYHAAHSLSSLAFSICRTESLSLGEIHANVLYTLIVLGTKTNHPPRTILDHALEHLHCRINLNTGSTQCRKSLSMAHCALAHAYLLNGNYTEAIKNCHRARKVASDDIEDSKWFGWADVFETWCLIATVRLEEGETVILQRYAKQSATQEAEGTNSFMLAQTLKCLANLRARQGLLEESFCNHKEALVNFVATTGCNSYEANILCVKVGEHHTRIEQYETAGIYFERAMDWFSVHDFYKPEVTFLQHKIALLRKAQEDEIGANESRAKVEKLYKQLVPGYTGKTWLSDREVDEVVVLTSR